MSDAYKPEYTMLGIGGGSVYGRVGPNVSATIYDRRLMPYLGDLAEGGIIIDNRPCYHRDDFVHMVVSGPMLKEDLPPQTRSEPFVKEPIPCTDAKQAHGFDYVSLDLYLAFWREAGSRIGKRQGNQIQWENGEVTEIPNEEERYMVQGKILQDDPWQKPEHRVPLCYCYGYGCHG